jgi:diguanylate cyclase (GGDEF)-like protein/PAS domain S-box-containing protein
MDDHDSLLSYSDPLHDECLKEFQRLQFAIRSSEDGIWEYNIQKNTTYVSKQWLEIIGYDEDEYHSSIDAWKALLHPEDAENAVRVLYSSIANKVESAHVRYRIRHKNGNWLWIHDRAKIHFDPLGEPLIVAGFRTDITEQVELENHNQELAAIVQHATIEVYVVDAETLTYRYANDGALKALGYTLQELQQLTITDINPDISDDQIEIFRQYLTTISPVLSNFSHQKRKNGTQYPVQATIHNLTYQGRPAIVIFGTDITELTLTQEQLLHLATHDSLTGLPNRVLFHDRLHMAIKKNQRKNDTIAILFIDLDHFQKINDSLGHPVGDKHLIQVAKRFGDILRECDTIARIGGDEFNILIDGLNNTEPLIDIAEKLIRAFQEPFSVDGRLMYSTLSIGIALSPNDGTTTQNLLKNADTAMYRAKNEGRNTYRFYAHEMGEKAYERIEMENALRLALKENQFAVYYQPQVDLLTQQWVGMEALVRWNHPTLGIVSPAIFIPLCEETGLIQEIDFFVLESVVKQHAAWESEKLNVPKTAVNFSAKTLAKPHIAKEVESILKFHRCNAQCIAIEVTESLLMADPQEAIYILEEFKKLGLEISIDDFGTGYSSLSYLKRLPINKLKIDQSFIHDIPHDDDDMAITKTIIGLAYNLKLDVIAEGIETLEQQSFLLENGCPLGQGYLFDKPLDTATTTARLQMDNNRSYNAKKPLYKP